MIHRGTSVSLAFCLVLVALAARADDDPGSGATAAQFFRAGLAAYESHEYRAAALAFVEAFHHAPRGAAIYNAGRSWEAAGDQALAADAFSTALASGDLEDGDAQTARDRLASLAPLLAIVDVRGPASAKVSVDGIERPRPHSVYLAPGTHQVHLLCSDGSVIDRSFSLQAGESSALSIDGPPPAPSPAPAASAPEVSRNASAPDRLPSARAITPWGWVALGATIALGAAGTVTYLKFVDDRASFDASGDQDSNLHEEAIRNRTATYVLWAVAGASGIAAALDFALGGSGSQSLKLGFGIDRFSVAATF